MCSYDLPLINEMWRKIVVQLVFICYRFLLSITSEIDKSWLAGLLRSNIVTIVLLVRITFPWMTHAEKFTVKNAANWLTLISDMGPLQIQMISSIGNKKLPPKRGVNCRQSFFFFILVSFQNVVNIETYNLKPQRIKIQNYSVCWIWIRYLTRYKKELVLLKGAFLVGKM